ncbi:MAG: 3(2), 5-bisphosphate nucleotidase [Solirubrobacteraceae bacterium]
MTDTLTVRSARYDDTPLLDQALSADPDGTEHLQIGFATPLSRTLVATSGGAIRGCLHLQARPTPQRWEAHITALRGADDTTTAQLIARADREAAILGARALIDRQRRGFLRELGFGPHGERPVRFGADGPLAQRFLRSAARAANAVAAVVAQHRPTTGPLDPADKRLDLTAEQTAAATLQDLGIAILSEERGHLGAPLDPHGPWISLDPIDGTRNCLRGYPPWAISVGLIDDGRPIAGLVVDLCTGQRWWTAPELGAHVDGLPARPRPDGLLILPSTNPGAVPELSEVDGLHRLRVAGATAIDLCRVADGSAGAFLDTHRAISQAHDISAATAVIAAAGATILDADTAAPPTFDPLEPERHYHLVAAATERQARQLLEDQRPVEPV